MKQTTKRAAALLLTVFLLAPAALAVPSEEGPTSFLSTLWEQVVEKVRAVFVGSETELGPDFDPDGSNLGPAIDPDGNELGPAIDPNGQVSSTEDEGDLGPTFDPNG